MNRHENNQGIPGPPAEEAPTLAAGVGRAGREGPAPGPRGGRLGPPPPPDDGGAADEEAPPAWGRAGRDGIAPPARRGTVTMFKYTWDVWTKRACELKFQKLRFTGTFVFFA